MKKTTKKTQNKKFTTFTVRSHTSETKQSISDILYNIEIIKKKVKLNKFSKEELKKLDMELFLWT